MPFYRRRPSSTPFSLLSNSHCTTNTHTVCPPPSRSSNYVGLSAMPLPAIITPEHVRPSRIHELNVGQQTVWWCLYNHPAASKSLVSPNIDTYTSTQSHTHSHLTQHHLPHIIARPPPPPPQPLSG
uniref:Uncharacterized protein n=1 Tax=Oncorhynchus mykiss TaxID=8022 RepID=A0A8L0DPL2_ONCMY